VIYSIASAASRASVRLAESQVGSMRQDFLAEHGKYDVIVFGLLDSHTGSPLRNMAVNNYVYHEESFRRCTGDMLNPAAFLVLNSMREPWTWMGGLLYNAAAIVGRARVYLLCRPKPLNGGLFAGRCSGSHSGRLGKGQEAQTLHCEKPCPAFPLHHPSAASRQMTALCVMRLLSVPE